MPPQHDICYICAQSIAPDDRDRDHVPPRNLFNREDRDDNLITLPTHRACNAGFSRDDNWFQLMTSMVAAPGNEQAQRLWDGPVMRGFHRDEAAGFRAGILQNLVEVEVESPEGIFLGTAEVMLQDAERVRRMVNRTVRGLYTHKFGAVVPPDWPVSCDLIDPNAANPFVGFFRGAFQSKGNGTFRFALKHLPDEPLEAWAWLVFFDTVHYWGYIGDKIRATLQLGDP